MQRFTNHLNPRRTRTHVGTPLTQPIAPGQVQNSDGSFVWVLDPWARALRFLILGTEGGTFYIGERKLTQENATAIKQCAEEDPKRLVDLIVDVSQQNRAHSNDPALFALAMCAAFGATVTAGDFTTDGKAYALATLPKVARIGTHLFHFVAYVQELRGWGRGLKNAVASWYNGQTPKGLAVQLTKYQQRDGFSHRDVLRLAHPKPITPSHDHMFKLAVGKVKSDDDVPAYIRIGKLTARAKQKSANADEIAAAWRYLGAVRSMRADMPVAAAVSLITEYGLQREHVPTELLTKPEIWEALLPNLGLHALIRNLPTLTRVGLVAPLSAQTRAITGQLQDVERLRKERVHPMALLIALTTYQQGKSEKGSSTWTPVGGIVDALDEAFYLSFGTVVPAGTNHLLAVDVSGSMDGTGWSGAGSFPNVRPGLSPRMCAAAMAMLAMRTEPWTYLVAFSHRLQHVSTASPRQRMDDVLRMFRAIPMGATDCSLPMRYAAHENLDVDTFVVYTDSETNTGSHPKLALEQYRQKRGRDARLIVVGMVSNGFTIADPNDRGMLDVVGFDASAPQVMSTFARGEL